MMTVPVREGFIRFRDYQTFYRVVGDLSLKETGKVPVLTIHGRPPSHEVLEPLEKLAEAGRPVIFYDQLGCGRSDRPDNAAMWTMSRFVEEVAAIRQQLNLEQVHLLGHSWGGMVAMEYALSFPGGLVSLILASTCCDQSLFDADYDQLRKELPQEVYTTLLGHEAAGTTGDPAYKQADRFFAQRHICRLDPWPEYYYRSLEHMPAGWINTQGWSVRGRLDEIEVATLITCGRYDICTPAQAQIIHEGIRGSELVIYEDSSHHPHIEENDKYLATLSEFMTKIEQRAIKKS